MALDCAKPSAAELSWNADDAPYVPKPAGTVTFNRDIAPIVFKECAFCHQAGQAAPIELLTYTEVARHAKQIAKVTAERLMPPWLPEPACGDFANERRLTAREIGLIEQWERDGAPEGTGSPPPAPVAHDGWFLGQPDLIVTMPETYMLTAEGPDVYRNFVLPVSATNDHYIRAVQFLPGNSRIVHHAFIKLDSTGASRRLDTNDPGPGFSGMDSVAEMPAGQFLSWQPGRLPVVAPEGLTWRLPKASDLIVETHLKTSGKPEKFQPSVGLYFTNAPPSKLSARALLNSLALDIPAGDSNYVVADSFTLPVDATLLSILPHMHYVGKEVESHATLPDGKTIPLIWIKHWNFDWQTDYTYKEPIHLPKGATVHMRFVYDNSANNPRNPNNPPKRVVYGPQSSDEMCELWLQLVIANPADAQALEAARRNYLHRVFRAGAEHRLRLNPRDADAHIELGVLLFTRGDENGALRHWREAAQIDPKLAEPHYQMGILFRKNHLLPRARQELETAIRLNPNLAEAYGHLGFIMAELGNGAAAEQNFIHALELNPNDTIIRDTLAELRAKMGAGRK
jgi:hypothetical protein